MQLQPLNNNILIRVDEPEKVTAGGVLLPDSAHAAPPNTATVVAVGPGKVDDRPHILKYPAGDVEGKLIAQQRLAEVGTASHSSHRSHGLRPGDRVIFKPYKLDLIPNTDDRQLAIIDADHIIGKIVPEVPVANPYHVGG